jgi:protein-S-isoprenylcysteine O-methyltransferase Ste14
MWRGQNVPVPEPYLLGIAAGAWLQRVRPWRLPGPRSLNRVIGSSLVAVGTYLVARSVLVAGQVDLDRPDELVTSGPYAVSRNPMYLGWALLHLGAGIASRSGWILVAFPLGAERVHRQILREERELGARFPAEYGPYCAEVPRYLRSGHLPKRRG